MHIKMPEFPKARDVVAPDVFQEGSFNLKSTILEGFWCSGFAYLGYNSPQKAFYVEVRLTLDDTLIATSGEIACQQTKQSITSAYNKALKALKTAYTEWVYGNILDNVISIPAAASN